MASSVENLEKLYEQFENWRSDTKKTLDEFYEKKKLQIDQFVCENKENLPQIRFRPIEFDENLIQIENDIDLNRIDETKILKLIYSQKSSAAIAANTKTLLFHQNPFLCLIDENFRICRQIEWKFDWIRDGIWSETLNSFVLITVDRLFIVDSSLNSIVQRPIVNKRWFSCSASRTSLFLSTWQWGSMIYQFDLSSNDDDFSKDRPEFFSCRSTEGILDLEVNKETLALMIKDSTDCQYRLELKSIETKETIWFLMLNKTTSIRLLTCSIINDDEWIIVDGNSSKLHHVTKDGKMKTVFDYFSVPYRAIRFGSNGLVVSAETQLNFHSMSSLC